MLRALVSFDGTIGDQESSEPVICDVMVNYVNIRYKTGPERAFLTLQRCHSHRFGSS